MGQSFHSSSREGNEDIDSLINNLKNIDDKDGEITNNFITSLFDLNKCLTKDNEIRVINKKCELIRNVCREDDYDAADGFVDELKQAKNRLVAFVRKAVNNE